MSNNEAPRCGGFLLSEAPGTLSRDSIILLGLNDGATVLQAGALLGRISKGTATATAAAANSGNGTIGTISRSAGLMGGGYQLVCIRAATNGGTFTVEDPSGQLVGEATVGSAFSGGGLTFTISDGSNDFAVGDRFTITVAAGSGKYVAWDPAGFDGRETAFAVLYAEADVSGSGDVSAVAISRCAEVKEGLLGYGSATSDERSDAVIQLRSLGIIVRATV